MANAAISPVPATPSQRVFALIGAAVATGNTQYVDEGTISGAAVTRCLEGMDDVSVDRSVNKRTAYRGVFNLNGGPDAWEVVATR